MTQFELLIQMLFNDIDFPCFSVLKCWAAKHYLDSAERFLHVLFMGDWVGTHRNLNYLIICYQAFYRYQLASYPISQ